VQFATNGKSLANNIYGVRPSWCGQLISI